MNKATPNGFQRAENHLSALPLTIMAEDGAWFSTGFSVTRRDLAMAVPHATIQWNFFERISRLSDFYTPTDQSVIGRGSTRRSLPNFSRNCPGLWLEIGRQQ